MATIFTFPKASRVGDRVEILSISNEKMPINIVANPEAEKPLELVYPDNVYSGEPGGTIAVVQITDVNVLFIEEDSGERFLGRNTINQQDTGNFELQPNESVILKNEIDPLYESDELATKLNYGLIKIGTNISCVDGVISRKKVQINTDISNNADQSRRYEVIFFEKTRDALLRSHNKPSGCSGASIINASK